MNCYGVACITKADTGRLFAMREFPGGGMLIRAEKGWFLARMQNGAVPVDRASDAGTGPLVGRALPLRGPLYGVDLSRADLGGKACGIEAKLALRPICNHYALAAIADGNQAVARRSRKRGWNANTYASTTQVVGSILVFGKCDVSGCGGHRST